ncbi:MAG TPA: TraX protein [Ruminococcaceae bacterium]|nr:TraX protein [Oscillospiraceae bacterium]
MTGQRIIPEKYRFISGSALKVIAVITMLIDHVALMFMRDSTVVLLSFGKNSLTLYYFLRCVGRIAFPLYAFLLVEGFLHTRNRLKYGVSLAVMALVSEFAWNLEHTGTLFYSEQNVMFTLLAGYLAMCATERFKTDALKLTAIMAVLTAAAFTLHFDYGFQGFAFILLLYLLRDMAVVRDVLGICVLPSQWIGGLAFLPVAFYNGKRGFIKGAVLKYAFYAFYPAHLFVIYLIKYVFTAK